MFSGATVKKNSCFQNGQNIYLFIYIYIYIIKYIYLFIYKKIYIWMDGWMGRQRRRRRHYGPPFEAGASLHRMLQVFNGLELPENSVLSSLFPTIPATVLCILAQVAFPSKPFPSPWTSRDQGLRQFLFLSPPFTVSPFARSLCKSAFVHSRDVAGPLPFSPQARFSPHPDPSALRVLPCYARTMLDPLDPWLICVATGSSDPPEHAVLGRREGSPFLLREQPRLAAP